MPRPARPTDPTFAGKTWTAQPVHYRPRSKHGEARRVPINAAAESAFLDLAAQRDRPDDPSESIFKGRPQQADKFFPRAVKRASETLKEAGREATRLQDSTWHGNRHTFGSRLAMAGVPDRTIQELGGWKTLKMVQRYSHLSAAYLHAAVGRLVPGSSPQGFKDCASAHVGAGAVNFDETSTATWGRGSV